MSAARKLLIFGGLALAAFGMLYGLHYALFVDTKYNYVRQVDAHSHWIGLAMVMIILGVVLERLAFSEGTRVAITLALAIGSFSFPSAVILQTLTHRSSLSSGVSVVGSALVILAMVAAAVGFARQRISA